MKLRGLNRGAIIKLVDEKIGIDGAYYEIVDIKPDKNDFSIANLRLKKLEVVKR